MSSLSEFRRTTRGVNNPARPNSDWKVFQEDPFLAASGLGATVTLTTIAKHALSSSKKPEPAVPSKTTAYKMGEFVRENPKLVGSAVALGVGYGLYKGATKSSKK